MKKTLIALAAMAAASASFAQVTLYGVVDQGVYSEKTTLTTGVNGTVTGVRNVLSGNRWGIRASESLGGGLNAAIQMEYGALVDGANASGALNTNRNSFIQLSGGFGGVKLGQPYTLLHNVQGAFDANGNATSGGWLGSGTSRVRQNNAIEYTSPSMSGFSLQVQYGFGEANAPVTGGSSEAGNAVGFGLNFMSGPLTVMLATETVKLAALNHSFVPTTVIPAALSSADTDNVATSFGASYDLGVAKVMALRTSMKAGTTTPAEVTTNNLGVSVPFGAMTFNASLGNGSIAIAGTNIDAAAYQLGLNYGLSKRTTAYGLIGTTTLKTGSDVTSDVKVETMSIGVRHTF